MRLQYGKFGLVLLVLFCNTSQAASYYGGGSYGDVGVGIRYDDNVSRAQDDPDIKDDWITSFNASFVNQTLLNPESLLGFTVQAQYERMDEFKSLDNVSVSLTADYLYQPQAGYFSPWYEASVGISRIIFDNSTIRDSELLDLSVSVGKRLTTKFIGTLAYQYEQRFSERKVFDLVNHKVIADGEYQVMSNGVFYANYQASFGESVSTATPNSRIVDAAEAVAPDDVFSAGLGPGCMNRRCAYRLDSTTHQFSTGFNFEILNNFELDVATNYYYIDATGDNHYDGFIHRANIWYLF